MNDFITTTGIILKCSNVGEYDKRLVFLTKDRGKITVFGRGVRKQSSRFLAACSPFCYGQIKAFPGKDAYSLMDFSVDEYFEPLRSDFEISCYAMYFLEICDYYARENNDEYNLLKLLYVGLKALAKVADSKLQMSLKLIRYIFELKSIIINGEYPGVPQHITLSETASYALRFIEATSVEKLFAFSISEEAEKEIGMAAGYITKGILNTQFKSLELIL